MSTSRDQILARIRAATAGPPAGERTDRDVDVAYAALPRKYLRAHHDAATHDITALFAERAADYRAVVERVPGPGLAAAIGRVLAARVLGGPGPDDGSAVVSGPILVPDGLPADWLAGLPAGITLARDEPPLPAAELDRAAGAADGLRGRGRRDRHDHPGPRPRPGPPRAHPGARLPPGHRPGQPGRRRPG